MKSALGLNLEERDSHNELDGLIIDAVATFRPLIPETKMNSFEASVRKLFSDAIAIHTTMLRSKAIFIVQWTGECDGKTFYTYDPQTMKVFQGGINASAPDYLVQLIESPVVWKIGNADGQDFGSRMVICKSLAVLGEERAAEIAKM